MQARKRKRTVRGSERHSRVEVQGFETSGDCLHKGADGSELEFGMWLSFHMTPTEKLEFRFTEKDIDYLQKRIKAHQAIFKVQRTMG